MLVHEPIRWLHFQPVVGALDSWRGLKGLSWEPIRRLAGRPRVVSPQPRRRVVVLLDQGAVVRLSLVVRWQPEEVVIQLPGEVVRQLPAEAATSLREAVFMWLLEVSVRGLPAAAVRRLPEVVLRWLPVRLRWPTGAARSTIVVV